MAQSSKGKLNYRCPMCFFRDLDIDMFYDKDKKEYYCLRCRFRGGRSCQERAYQDQVRQNDGQNY